MVECEQNNCIFAPSKNNPKKLLEIINQIKFRDYD